MFIESKARILIVDDQELQLNLVKSILLKAGYLVEIATGGEQAIKRLLNKNALPIHVVLLDRSMPKTDGLAVLKVVRPALPTLPIIMLTAHSSIHSVVEAMRAGASDFVVKPASAERLRRAVEAALNLGGAVGHLSPLEDALKTPITFENFIGGSAPTVRTINLAKRAASSTIPVLLNGESGVGKGVFAQAIHHASNRREKPFITINCGSLLASAAEDVLFGHKKNAFDGAMDDQAGAFEKAKGGTLFLDEVGELPMEVQTKVLRAVQDGKVQRIGSDDSINVDVRLISATNQNLKGLVDAGNFREDLYYRITVFPIGVPPLRVRQGDIPDLTRYFIKKIATIENISQKSLTADAMNLLIRYHWPGNISQLYNTLFRAMVMEEKDVIGIQAFQQLVQQEVVHVTGKVLSIRPQKIMEMAEAKAVPGQTLSIQTDKGEIKPLAEIEEQLIRAALDHYNGKMSKVARQLGIGRSTLYRKMEQYNILKP